MKYLVYGVGLSTNSVIKYFHEKEIDYEIYTDDMNQYPSLVTNNENFVVIKSPGVKSDTPLMKKLIVDKLEIITDIEFFYRIRNDLFYLIVTGSNGKTTTCHILESLLANDHFIAVGNMGKPIFDYINTDKDLIIECSSYMLEYTKIFKPHVFIFLNIESHHQSAHKTFSNYLEAKLKPLRNMNNNDYLIYNLDDKVLSKTLSHYDLIKYTFSFDNQNATMYYKDEIIWYKKEPFVKVKNLSLEGMHNVANIMASLLGMIAVNELKSKRKIEELKEHTRKVINQITGLPHRMEKIYDKNKIIIYNDSKATNVYAAITALKMIQTKYPNYQLLFIVGGKKEKQDYSILRKYLLPKTKCYLYGENIDDVKKELDGEFFLYETLDQAVTAIKDHVLPNSVILFSPAAPSFDQFQNFEARGDHFKMLVKEFFF